MAEVRRESFLWLLDKQGRESTTMKKETDRRGNTRRRIEKQCDYSRARMQLCFHKSGEMRFRVGRVRGRGFAMGQAATASQALYGLLYSIQMDQASRIKAFSLCSNK